MTCASPARRKTKIEYRNRRNISFNCQKPLPQPRHVGQLPMDVDPTWTNRNATWDHMMQDSGNTSNSGNNCSDCTGSGHIEYECPNRYQVTKEKWNNLTAEHEKRRCVRCGGFGHWAFMQPKSDRNAILSFTISAVSSRGRRDLRLRLRCAGS